MKKTLFTILTLSSVAAYAVETQDAAVNIMQTSQYKNSTWNYTSTVWGSQAFTLTNVSVEPTITSSNGTYCNTGTSYNQSFATVNTNTGLGGAFDYTINFTVEFNPGITSVTLSSIGIDVFALKGGGAPQDSVKKAKCGYTLSSGDTVIASSTSNSDLTVTIPNACSTNQAVYTGDATNGYALAQSDTPGVLTITLPDIALQNGGSYSLKLNNVTNNGGGATLLGLGNVAFTGLATPEPATATLSLLALAGLAARRRRH